MNISQTVIIVMTVITFIRISSRYILISGWSKITTLSTVSNIFFFHYNARVIWAVYLNICIFIRHIISRIVGIIFAKTNTLNLNKFVRIICFTFRLGPKYLKLKWRKKYNIFQQENSYEFVTISHRCVFVCHVSPAWLFY